MKSALFLLTTLALLPSAFSSSRADLLFQLTPDTQIATGTTPLLFGGTLSNNGNALIYLNGSDFSALGNALEIDDTPFLTNAPLSLAPNESWSGTMFTTRLNADVPLDVYTGTFNILGGASSEDRLTLASSEFHVVTVPAPQSWAVLLFGVAPGLCWLRRRRSR